MTQNVALQNQKGARGNTGLAQCPGAMMLARKAQDGSANARIKKIRQAGFLYAFNVLTGNYRCN